MDRLIVSTRFFAFLSVSLLTLNAYSLSTTDDDSGEEKEESEDDFIIVNPSACQEGVLCDVGDEVSVLETLDSVL